MSGRRADWAQRLAAFLQTRATTPFAWGANDCCTFAGDAVQIMTGNDPMRSLRGRYRTRRGAIRLIKQYGGIERLVQQVLGSPLPAAALASRGDVVLLPDMQGQGPALGICVGANLLAAGHHGTVAFPLSAALAAWRV
jgi:hypothetical protein